MTFAEFEALAWQEWERIPEQYRAGVDGLTIERRALPHPELEDVYTLGECVTEAYPSAFEGPDTTRSTVVLYYGSFFRLSRLDAEFQWAEELYETLTHELQHHLESLAADDSLIDMDYAADENYRRYHGEPFDPYFYRAGVPVDGWFRVEDEFFLEIERDVGPVVTFEWRGRTYRVDVPRESESGDVALLTITHGVVDPPGALHLALVSRPGLMTQIRRLFRPRRSSVVELDVVAVPLES